jgi:hypothetical protein
MACSSRIVIWVGVDGKPTDARRPFISVLDERARTASSDSHTPMMKSAFSDVAQWPCPIAHQRGECDIAGARANERTDIEMDAKPTIVLVHGDWADGSSWNEGTKRLIARGYVVVPPNRCAVRSRTARTSGASSRRSEVRSCLPRIPTVLRDHQRSDWTEHRQGARLHRRVHSRGQ